MSTNGTEEIIANIHRRMTTQDEYLQDIRDKLVAHITEEALYKATLDEIVVLWRGSKVIIPAMLALAIAVVSLLTWFREHVK